MRENGGNLNFSFILLPNSPHMRNWLANLCPLHCVFSENAATYAVLISANFFFSEHYHFFHILVHQHFVSSMWVHQVLLLGNDDARVVPYIHKHHICGFGKISEGAPYNQKQLVWELQ